ncbi:MAG: outer membrane lipoprotein carrier protein LolA [Bacteroidales bacterium]|nr:outer membrane lipoprotein carrier protein LolA [Bacteroidales bacterium]
MILFLLVAILGMEMPDLVGHDGSIASAPIVIAGPDRQSPDDLALIREACSSIKTMQCDFEQEKISSLLADKPVSKGKMWFDGKNVRWEYKSPEPFLFVMDGTLVLLEGKERNIKEIKTDRLFSRIAKLADGNNIMLGQGLDRIPDFDAILTREKEVLIVELIPIRHDLQLMFRKVRLHFGSDYRVQKLELLEKGSDRTVITLKNQKYNAAIPAKLFEIE